MVLSCYFQQMQKIFIMHEDAQSNEHTETVTIATGIRNM